MAENDITIVVDADNRTTASFGAAARGANTVGDAVNNANRSFREADNRYQTAALRLQQLSNRQREAADRARFLQTSLAYLNRQLHEDGDSTGELTRQIADLSRQERDATASSRLLALQHGRSAEQVNDLARAYRRAEHNAQQALRASLMFGAGARLGPDGRVGAGGNGDDGPSGWARMLSRLTFGVLGTAGGAAGAAGQNAANPAGLAMLGGGLLAAGIGAPFIGGAVGGAVGAVGGIAGVGLGVAGAIANDPDEFRKRWDAVIGDVTGRWVKASASWMEPVKGAIDEVDAALKDLPIESILSDSAAYLDPLVKGLTGFADGFATGFASLVKDAGPVIEMLGDRLPKLGGDIGNFFAAIGKGSEGGADALDDLLSGLGRLTKGLGVTISALGQLYSGIKNNVGALADMGNGALTWLANLTEGVPLLDKLSERIKAFQEDDKPVSKGFKRFAGTAEAEESFQRVETAAEKATKAIDAYVSAIDDMLDQRMADKNAGLALSEGWLTLNEELREGKRTLDLNTQAGVDNQKALLAQVGAAEAARQKQIELTGDIGMANAMFDANIERIRSMAYALGFNKGQVDALISSLGVLNVTSAAPKVELQGAQLAMSQGIALGAILNNLNHSYFPKVQVVTGGGVSLGNALHHAAGGPTSPGPSIINEWAGLDAQQGGGEVVNLPTGSMVYGGAAAQGGGQSGGSGGGGTTTLVLDSAGSRLDDLLIEIIRSTISAQGGRPELLGLKIAK